MPLPRKTPMIDPTKLQPFGTAGKRGLSKLAALRNAFVEAQRAVLMQTLTRPSGYASCSLSWKTIGDSPWVCR